MNFLTPPLQMKHKRHLLLLWLLVQSLTLHAEIKPNALFADHLVLQRDKPVPIWGTADAAEKITVSFAGQVKTTEADAKGQWRVTLDPIPASSEPHELNFKSEISNFKFTDVLVGDVWICSGQSNMERQLGLRSGQQPLVNWEQEAASANYPHIRHFAVDRKFADTPQLETKGAWEVCSPATVPNFTAVGYYFGRDLHQKLKIPIGLIHASWGGTPAEAWTRTEALQTSLPEVSDAQKKAVAEYPATLEKYHAEESLLLATWEKAVAEAKAAGKPEPRKPGPPRDPSTGQNRPSVLFNGMISPLLPVAMRGVIWYQGESNAGRALQYQTLFPLLIADWRQQWQQGEFPFFFVQIAPFKGQNPEIREAQLLTWKKTPNTAMVVTADVGDAEDIHPTRKEPVGQRLALAARALVYGENIVYSGPVYESVTIKGNRAVLRFTHLGGGLVAKDGELKGFTIAGSDQKFVPAQAKIEGDQIVVSAPEIPAPVAVRYGWANVPEVNLFNQAGLPASPFRTDNWTK
jgi:sialate O-acetylesterase